MQSFEATAGTAAQYLRLSLVDNAISLCMTGVLTVSETDASCVSTAEPPMRHACWICWSHRSLVTSLLRSSAPCTEQMHIQSSPATFVHSPHPFQGPLPPRLPGGREDERKTHGPRTTGSWNFL